MTVEVASAATMTRLYLYGVVDTPGVLSDRLRDLPPDGHITIEVSATGSSGTRGEDVQVSLNEAVVCSPTLRAQSFRRKIDARIEPATGEETMPRWTNTDGAGAPGAPW